MNVYTCTDHDGHWVGVASVIVANSQTEAAALLRAALHEHGLIETQPFTLQQLDLTVPAAHVLQDGDY